MDFWIKIVRKYLYIIVLLSPVISENIGHFTLWQSNGISAATLWQFRDMKFFYQRPLMPSTIKIPYIPEFSCSTYQKNLRNLLKPPIEPFLPCGFICTSEFSLYSNAVVKRIVLFCLNIRLDNCYENIVARISQNVYPQEDLF